MIDILSFLNNKQKIICLIILVLSIMVSTIMTVTATDIVPPKNAVAEQTVDPAPVVEPPPVVEEVVVDTVTDRPGKVVYPITGEHYDRIKANTKNPKVVNGITVVSGFYRSPFLDERITDDELKEDIQQFILAIKRDPTITNIRQMPRNWFMYEIENGTVVCRDHAIYSDMACWKK